jgi:C-terminal processing protease CtpA/Prc
MENGRAKVVRTLPRMPAAKAGIMPNDIVTDVDAEPLEDLALDQVVEKLRGPAGTTARLRIVRKGQDAPVEVPIVRAPIKLPGAGDLQVAVKDGKLLITATGTLPVLDFDKGAPVAVNAMSESEFFVDRGDHTRLVFERDAAGKPARLVLNPGLWQITGQRIN